MTLTIYPELAQGSDEWLQARAGIVTASVIGKLVTPTLKVADNDAARDLFATLATERITGLVDPIFPNMDMRRGTELEPYARDIYAEHYASVDEAGFIVAQYDGYRIGFSPDGLIGESGLLEIKSRKPKIQLRAILRDEVPGANIAQLQTGLLVTGRDWIDYVSYSPGLPLYVKRVEPDPKWFQALTGAAENAENKINALVDDYTSAIDAKGYVPTGYVDPFEEPDIF